MYFSGKKANPQPVLKFVGMTDRLPKRENIPKKRKHCLKSNNQQL
jgi:hypothetical protein